LIPPRFLTVEQVAETMAVKPATVRAWCRRGFIHAVKHGKGWRIPESVVQEAAAAPIAEALADRVRALTPAQLERLAHYLETLR
jgi:excisionase family DNA binding protein